MPFRIENYGDQMCIVDEETEFCAGRIQFRVTNEHAEEVGIVNSPEDAIAVLDAHIASRPPPNWERLSATEYEKETWYGVLRVERASDGSWYAFCNIYSVLSRDGVPAIFQCHSEARAAADAHLQDRFPTRKVSNDDLSWLDIGPEDRENLNRAMEKLSSSTPS